ncbi:MAG: hypothetical protein KIT11_09885 [Fimbriimonadaceae bacterium]|nr:hypothetical protein [Fimbriimonadaceae bacterium]QYK55634.1 MAG: hypothetical protein KF733_11555 [Fimbriimonadaceae bacterium]
MKTELVWEGKYDEYGNRRPVKLPTSPLPLQRIETIDAPCDAATGKSNEQRAMQAFVALSTKFLQATPGGSVPLAPPTTPFTGDTVVVTATATTGKVTFTANQPNASNVTTEILLQPLASQIRNPQKGAYRTKKFFRFLPGSLSTDVDVPAGWYAAAVRFVKTTTGQAATIQPIGISQVSFSVAESGSGSKKKAA